jgi:Heterokaryon incompatibility protein (HET)
MLTTTKATLTSWQQSIPWDRLSKTFQDAILVTRDLGLQYLWIDSLCIIQDDANDWAVESTKMAKVYGDAHVVLAATAGSDGNHGCLFPRGPTHRIPFENAEGPVEKAEAEVESHISILIREVIAHTQLLGSYKSPLSAIGYPRNLDSPLLSRAWCYQEQLLAARMLHFHASELRWECRTKRACECGGLGAAITARENHPESSGARWTLPLAAAHESADQLLVRWADQVGQYSIRNLTYETDRLVALAGVASTFQCEQLGRYVAGLWEKGLLEGLQWERPSRMDLEFEQSLRPKTYRAPSWSWASLEGDVGFRNTRGTKFKAQTEIERLDFELQNPLNPYGSVISARLVVRGKLVPAILRVEEYETNCCSWLTMEGAKGELQFRTDIPAAPWLPQQTATPEVENSMQLGCLYLGIRSADGDFSAGDNDYCPTYHVMLVVHEVKGQSGEYRRVGILHMEAKQMGRWNEVKEKTLMLV